MAISIGDVKLIDNSAQIKGMMEQAKARALEAIGLQAEGYAKKLCPVGTPESTGKPHYIGGTLRNSISHATDNDSAYIGTNVEYAPYVELGTSRMKAQPYLKPAATEHSDEYRAIVEQQMKNG